MPTPRACSKVDVEGGVGQGVWGRAEPSPSLSLPPLPSRSLSHCLARTDHQSACQLAEGGESSLGRLGRAVGSWWGWGRVGKGGALPPIPSPATLVPASSTVQQACQNWLAAAGGGGRAAAAAALAARSAGRGVAGGAGVADGSPTFQAPLRPHPKPRTAEKGRQKKDAKNSFSTCCIVRKLRQTSGTSKPGIRRGL